MIQSYHDLEVWQLGRKLVTQTYRLTQAFPKHELYGLSSQMQRASISVPSNIAEGFSRKGTKDYIQFIVTAIGSLAELDTQAYLAEDLRYVNTETANEYRISIQFLLRKTYALRNSLQKRLTDA